MNVIISQCMIHDMQYKFVAIDINKRMTNLTFMKEKARMMMLSW